MKNLFCLIVIAVAIFGCSQEKEGLNPGTSNSSARGNSRLSGKVDVSSYAKIERSSSRSQLVVSLLTADGQVVNKISQLAPNSIYRLSVTSGGLDRVQVRSCFGFEILATNVSNVSGNFAADYVIKTQMDVSEPLFVSFLPLRQSNRVLVREQAQNFFLANN